LQFDLKFYSIVHFVLSRITEPRTERRNQSSIGVTKFAIKSFSLNRYSNCTRLNQRKRSNL